MRDRSGNPFVFTFKNKRLKRIARPAPEASGIAGHALLLFIFISIYSNTYSPHYLNLDKVLLLLKRDQ